MTRDEVKMRDCGYAEQILDFVYDELAGPAKMAFEGHLSQCSMCADDVTAFSSTSFAVREWRAEAFDSLSAPKIMLPKPVQVKPNFVASVLAFFRQPLYAATAATLLIGAAVGFYFLTDDHTPPQVGIALVNAVASAEKQAEPPSTAAAPSELTTRSDVDQTIATNVEKRSPTRRSRPQRARYERPITNSIGHSPNQTVASNRPSGQAAPEDLFGEVAETRDRSLRLTDLFAEDDED